MPGGGSGGGYGAAVRAWAGFGSTAFGPSCPILPWPGQRQPSSSATGPTCPPARQQPSMPTAPTGGRIRWPRPNWPWRERVLCWCPAIPACRRDCWPWPGHPYACAGGVAAGSGRRCGRGRRSPWWVPAGPPPTAWPWPRRSVPPWDKRVGRWSAAWRRGLMGRPTAAAWPEAVVRWRCWAPRLSGSIPAITRNCSGRWPSGGCC